MAYQRHSGARGKFLFRGPYFAKKMLAGGGGGGEEFKKNVPDIKKGSKHFSGQTPVN